jgi:hypothetical protein
MNRLICAIVLAAATTVLPARLPAQNVDPANGTWKLNLAKSKIKRVDVPQSETRKYEVSGDNVKLTTDVIDAQGKPIHWEISAKLDGKDYPITVSGLDAIALTRVDAHTTKAVTKKAGKPVVFTTRTVAKDGKTMTIEFRGSDEIGEKIDDMQVYDKQ